MADELVDAAGVRAQLERIGLRPSQRRQLAAGVERALLRFDAGQVAIYLGRKAREAQTVKYLLTAFYEYTDDISQIPFRRDDYATDQAFLAAVTEVQAAEEWLAAPSAPEPDHTATTPHAEPVTPVSAPSVAVDAPESSAGVSGHPGTAEGVTGESGAVSRACARPRVMDSPISRGRPSIRELKAQFDAERAPGGSRG